MSCQKNIQGFSKRVLCVGILVFYLPFLIPSISYAQASLEVDPGEIVATCFSGFENGEFCGPIDPDAPVVVLFDVIDPVGQGAVPDVNWQPPSFHNEPVGNPHYWSARNLGQVFGLAMDDAPRPNLFVTATRIYGDWADDEPGLWGPGGPGGVYRIDGSNGDICVLTQLPQPQLVPGFANGTGLGSIESFTTTGGEQFVYVSNFDDGLIYRIPTAECGVMADGLLTFDHGIDGRPNEGLSVIADNPGDRFSAPDRRIFGLGHNPQDNRLYYHVWGTREIWSVSLNPSTGAFLIATARREFTVPQPAGLARVSEITFSPAGHLFIAERTVPGNTGDLHMCGATAHQSRVVEFRLSGGVWVPEPLNKYEIGGIFDLKNSSGGVAIDCEENVWATADAIHLGAPYNDVVYGLQRIPVGGNSGAATTTSYIIDIDGNTSFDKTQVGQVVIRNECFFCEFESDNILCDLDEMGQPTGEYVITGTFTNLQDIPGTHLFMPPGAVSPAGVEVCFGNGQQGMQLPMPLNNGDSYEVGSDMTNANAIVIKNAMPEDEVCFRMTLLGDNGVECCTLEVCFEMPPCDCLQVDRRLDEITDIVCNDDGTVDFSYSFQLTNMFGQDVHHSFLGSLGPELFIPDYFDLAGTGPLAQGQSTILKTIVTGAQPGDEVDFLITIHNEDLSECCTRPHSVVAPNCDGTAPEKSGDDVLLGDMNNDGLVNLNDVQPFVQLLSSGDYVASGDVNEDGAFNLSDVAPFVDLLTGAP